MSNRIPYTRIPNAMQINSLSNFLPFQHFNYHGVADNLNTFAGTIG